MIFLLLKQIDLDTTLVEHAYNADDLPLIKPIEKKPDSRSTALSTGYESSLHLSEEPSTPHMTPSSSHEYLALRRLSLKEDIAAKSAFKVKINFNPHVKCGKKGLL